MSRNDERLIKGTAYIARIKDSSDDSNIHAKRDLLHVVAYDDPAEALDYMKLKNLVDNMNEGVILYSKVVNRKSRESFSWNQCLDELMGQPPIGDTCVAVHDRPISLGQMAKLAYEHHILRDMTGFNYLNSKLAPPTTVPAPDVAEITLPHPTGPAASRTGGIPADLDLEAVRKGIEQAQSLQQGDGLDNAGGLLGFEEEVANRVDERVESEDGQSMEYWKARAFTAETDNVSLARQLQNVKTSNTQLKSKLSSSEDAKAKFSVQADLAATRFNEYTAISTEPVIAALKPKLDCLPMILETVKDLSTKVLALGEIPAQVKSVNDALLALSEKMSDTGENFEMNRADDAETVICLVKRLDTVLAHFGFSSEVPPVNVPGVMSSLLSGTGKDVGVGSPSVHGYYTCGCGCGEVVSTIVDLSRPPPALLATAPLPIGVPTVPFAGTSSTADVGAAPSVPLQGQPPAVNQNSFLLDPRHNNNVPYGSLMNQPKPGLFMQTISPPQHQPSVHTVQSGPLKRGGGSYQYPGQFKRPY